VGDDWKSRGQKESEEDDTVQSLILHSLWLFDLSVVGDDCETKKTKKKSSEKCDSSVSS